MQALISVSLTETSDSLQRSSKTLQLLITLNKVSALTVYLVGHRTLMPGESGVVSAFK